VKQIVAAAMVLMVFGTAFVGLPIFGAGPGTMDIDEKQRGNGETPPDNSNVQASNGQGLAQSKVHRQGQAIGEAKSEGRATQDMDHDGLSDEQEQGTGTDPNNDDTDGDGLKDGEEVIIGTNPSNADTDGDGLPDPGELTLELDPNDWDTDDDGLRDGFETGGEGTDGHLQDTDDDGLVYHKVATIDEAEYISGDDIDCDGITNELERFYGTDPFCADSDSDGIMDQNELLRGLDPLDWDTDDDHISDGNELGGDISTDPKADDSDCDGILDPWEDNDGDGILNIEEQDVLGLLGIGGGLLHIPDANRLQDEYWYTSATDPNLADSDGDTLDDGYEIQLSKDRQNSALNVENGQLWPQAFLDYFQDLDYVSNFDMLAQKTGNTLLANHNTVWYNIDPHPFNSDYDWPDYDTSPTYVDLYGPYDPRVGWHQGETPPPNPSANWPPSDGVPDGRDTDGDGMNDNWDLHPLIFDDRLDTWAGIRSITDYQQNVFVNTACPNPGDPGMVGDGPPTFIYNEWGGQIPVVAKGNDFIIDIWMGFEDGQIGDLWKPMNITFTFVPVWDRDANGAIEIDGDDLDLDNATLSQPYSWLSSTLVQGPWANAPYTNDISNGGPALGSGTQMIRFYTQEFHLYTPASIPAGLIAVMVQVELTGNHYYEEPHDGYLVF